MNPLPTDDSTMRSYEDGISDHQTDDGCVSMSEGSTTDSSVYEADFSSYIPSVEWPRRNMPASEGRSSPAPSIYSFHESIDEYLFRDYKGRTYNTKNEAYFLPADMEEHQRHDVQNMMIRNYLGALYPAKELVDERLKPRDGYTPMILDVGTGSGAWAVDMSLQYPHCEVIGVDLVPPKVRDGIIPDNCRFEIDDCNLSFTHWANTFDVVHARAINSGILDYPAFLYNLAQIMKPGAILIIGGGVPQLFDENGQPYQNVDEGEKGFSWMQKYFTVTQERYFKSSEAFCISTDRPPDLESHSDQWARANPNFENVTSRNMKMQIGNWYPSISKEVHYANELFRLNLHSLVRSYAPMLIASGYPPDMAERLIIEARKELEELRVHSFGLWKWMWCTRTDRPWVPQNPEDAQNLRD